MKKNNKKWIRYLLLGGLVSKIFSWLFNIKRLHSLTDNSTDFVPKQRGETGDLISYDQSIGEFTDNSDSWFKDYFIPNDNNDNKPRILRFKSLLIIVLILVVLKLSLVGYLFLIYPSSAQMSEQITSQVLELTNQAREIAGLPEYRLDTNLSAAALAKANDMLDQNYFAHQGPDGKQPWEWIDRDSYPYFLVGENLAMNFSSAQSVQSALMLSASHQKNIMNEKYNDIGLAVVSGKLNGQLTDILVEFFAVQEKSIKPKIKVEKEPLIEPEFELTATDNKVSVLLKQPSSLPREPLKAEVIVSPNLLLETEPNEKIIWQISNDNRQIRQAIKLIDWSKIIYLIVLIALIIALLINIIVRFTIQHKSIIIPALVAIILIASLLFIKVHILESLLGQVAII